MKEQTQPVRLAIIGAGKGGTALLGLLHDDPSVKIIGVADTNPKAPGLALARRLKIPIPKNYRSLLDPGKIDLVMDVTGNREVAEALKQLNASIEVMGGHSAKFLWQLIEARMKGREEVERLLFEYQTLYDLGLKLTASENLDRLYRMIVDYAAHLIRTPAGSLAVFDEKRGEMSLGAVKGFSKNFTTKARWKLRQGGLTSRILNQEEPFVIADVSRFPKFDNPIMLREGIRSLIASPLKAEGRIMGILYVDDFKPRPFTPREISLVSLLSTLAAMAIEKTRLLESTRLLSITDELTGLYNHRHFRQQLNNEVSRTLRYGRHVSLMMIDIDHFKHYNDAHGHLKGNEVLKELGLILKEMSREVDIVARYGGEEFTIVLPETDRGKARPLAERLRKKIEAYPFEKQHTQPHKNLTVSIGLASCPQDASSSFELLEEADRALYKAKRQGRNRVCVPRKKHG